MKYKLYNKNCIDYLNSNDFKNDLLLLRERE